MTTNTITAHGAKRSIYLLLQESLKDVPFLSTERLKKIEKREPIPPKPGTYQEQEPPEELSGFGFLATTPEQREQDEKRQKAINRTARKDAERLFIESIHNKPLEQLLKEWKEKKAGYNRIADYLTFSYLFDIENSRNWEIAPTMPRPLYLPDTTEYAHINKKVRYDDISIAAILKKLWTEHKINKFDYKEAVKRSREGKPQREKIQEMISRYWGSIKAKAIKNTMSRMVTHSPIRGQINRRPFIFVEHNGIRYKVELLRKAYRRLSRWEELQREGISEEIEIINSTKQRDFKYISKLRELFHAQKIEEKRRETVAQLYAEMDGETHKRIENGNRPAILKEDLAEAEQG
jgi:hypothetical protein